MLAVPLAVSASVGPGFDSRRCPTLPMSTWPSADLWKRMAEDTLDDLTECPACRCPAATHYKDTLTQAFKCPPGGDPVKLREMVARAPKVPNAAFLAARQRDASYRAYRQAQQDAVAQLEELKRDNSDLQTLVPDITRIGTANPQMSMKEVIAEARRQFLDRLEADRYAERDRQNRRALDRLGAVVSAAKRLTGTTGFDAAPSYYNPDGIAPSRVERERQLQRPPKQKPAPVKRRFVLDEDE